MGSAKSLPVIMPRVSGQRWSCHSCGNCCRTLVVHLVSGERDRLDEQGWAAELGAKPYVRLGRNHVLNKTPDGSCVFLDEHNRCRIHARYGEDAKPIACRIFPFSVRRAGDAWQASLRFDCPSVTSSKGVPLQQHRAEVSKLAAELDERGLLGDARRAGRLRGREFARVKARGSGDSGGTASSTASPGETATFRRGLRATAEELDALTDALVHWFKRDDLPVATRLIGATRLTGMLQAARLKKVRGNRFKELVNVLIGALPGECRQEPTAPTPRQCGMLRQLAFAHAEHMSLERMRVGILGRLARRRVQLAAAQRFLKGVGDVPSLPGFEGGALFVDVESVKLVRDGREQTGDLLIRYVQMRLLGRSVCGTGYYGWPVFMGLSALWLSVAAAGWLARLRAALGNRSAVGFEDVAFCLGVVDRAATRAPSLGTLTERTRAGYLMADDGVARLISKYSLV